MARNPRLSLKTGTKAGIETIRSVMETKLKPRAGRVCSSRMIGPSDKYQIEGTTVTEEIKEQTDLLDRASLPCGWMRYGLLGLGMISTALGIAGIFLPVMPSTIFFLIALWAFSKSSLRLHNWLYHHPRYGRTVRAWHKNKSIPVSAKWAAVSMMTLSVFIVAVFVSSSWVLPVSIAAILTPVAAYIVTRPTLASETP